MKRTTRFYRKNEKEVMKDLGFRPTKNSGSGWIEKEDGENEIAICQLKSTDAQSISIKQKDLRMLEYHANLSHKTPVFAIQFLNTGEVWLLCKPNDIEIMGKGQGFCFEEQEENNEENLQKSIDKQNKESYNIREIRKAREAFNKQMEKERDRKSEEIKKRRREKRWKKGSTDREGLQSTED